jgi:hypothetical protein
MIKKIKSSIIIIRQIIKRPSREMSQKWREDELFNYEHETELRAGLY